MRLGARSHQLAELLDRDGTHNHHAALLALGGRRNVEPLRLRGESARGGISGPSPRCDLNATEM